MRLCVERDVKKAKTISRVLYAIANVAKLILVTFVIDPILKLRGVNIV